MGVRDAWKQDITGKGVKVAVIDSQVVSDYPGFADANISYKAVLENGLASCTAQTDQGVATLKASDSSLKAGGGVVYMRPMALRWWLVLWVMELAMTVRRGLWALLRGPRSPRTRMVWIAVSAVPQWMRSVRMTMGKWWRILI